MPAVVLCFRAVGWVGAAVAAAWSSVWSGCEPWQGRALEDGPSADGRRVTGSVVGPGLVRDIALQRMVGRGPLRNDRWCGITGRRPLMWEYWRGRGRFGAVKARGLRCQDLLSEVLSGGERIGQL